MKIALVHDYIKEYGGAERVLRVLADMYPQAPIYTAFSVKGSTAQKAFRDKKIIESWLAPLLRVWRLYSPLRFLIPVIWGTMDLSEYDVVVVSSSWYVTRGFKVGKNTRVICYCHAPPRWLYGYETSVGFTKYWPVKLYAAIVGSVIRKYDYQTAQKVDVFVANSQNVKARIKKFYHKDSEVIYPPVSVEEIVKSTTNQPKKNYFLIVSRLVGAKGIETAILCFGKQDKYQLKVVGEGPKTFTNSPQVEFLGRVDDADLWQLYAQAAGFIALARDEDFGMTVVEAQAAGTPVVAYRGGGFKESVMQDKTGIFIDEISSATILGAITKLTKTKWDHTVLQNNAMRFSRQQFEKKIQAIVGRYK